MTRRPKINKCCPSCLWYKDGCDGIYPHGADTSGHMHCHTEKTGSKKGDEKKKAEIKLKNTRWKIKQLQQKEKKLVAKLGLPKKKKETYGDPFPPKHGW